MDVQILKTIKSIWNPDKTIVYLHKYVTDEIKLGLVTLNQGKIVGRYLPSITV